MSRIGNKPIVYNPKVKVAVGDGVINIEGPNGKVSQKFKKDLRVTVDDQGRKIVVERVNESRLARALHGTTRALIANMVHGVTDGFQRGLDIIGVGYGAKVQGKKLEIQIGFCHPVVVNIPEGIKVELPQPTKVIIKGANKQVVGEFAAQIRRIRPPEPYKGKGIRYEDEKVIRKAGKAFGAGAT